MSPPHPCDRRGSDRARQRVATGRAPVLRRWIDRQCQIAWRCKYIPAERHEDDIGIVGSECFVIFDDDCRSQLVRFPWQSIAPIGEHDLAGLESCQLRQLRRRRTPEVEEFFSLGVASNVLGYSLSLLPDSPPAGFPCRIGRDLAKEGR